MPTLARMDTQTLADLARSTAMALQKAVGNTAAQPRYELINGLLKLIAAEQHRFALETAARQPLQTR